MRIAVGVRAEEDDLVRLKAFGDAARETANRRQRDVRRGVTVWLHVLGERLFLGHVVILQQNRRDKPVTQGARAGARDPGH